MVKIALEPEWEAKFSENTYGFRPGRCTADACMAVWHNLKNRKGEVVVLDADIEGCFDNLNHQYILDAMKGTSSNILKAVNQWFKCGYVDDGILHDTEAGTPQGGVISPLLCNIGLWGIDFEIYNHLITTRTPKDRNLKPFVGFVSNIKKRCREHAPSVGFMQYADDFVRIAIKSFLDGTYLGTIDVGSNTDCGGEVSAEETTPPKRDFNWPGWWAFEGATAPEPGSDLWRTLALGILNIITAVGSASIPALFAGGGLAVL